MKALLIKDWGLLKGQKQFFMVVGFIALVFLMSQENPAFVISYITVMFTVFTISSIQYDEYEKGLAYLFTLPVSRKEYVIEKYVFGVTNAIISSSFMVAAAVIISRIRGMEADPEIILVADVSAILVAVVFMAISIPVQLKFGAEKSRIVWMASFMVLFIVVFVGNEIIKVLGLSLDDVFGWMEAVTMGMVVAVVLAICAVLIVISFVLSVRFLEKREF